MCNCGNKRNEYAAQPQKLSNTLAGMHATKKMWPDVYFEYTGNSGLTVNGGVTGKRYRFNHRGDTQLIDYRDAGGMTGVPVLKKVTNKLQRSF
jgi:hypothetical protein